MAWDHGETVDAVCDRCGKAESFEGNSIGSGHFMFPIPEEVGWGYGDEGELCPDCLDGKELSNANV